MAQTIIFSYADATAEDNILSKATIKVGAANAKTLAEFGATFSNHTITIPGYGKINSTDLAAMGFVLSADAPAEEYTFTDGSTGTVKIASVDASAMTNAFTLAAASDTMASLTAGAGDDVVNAKTAALNTITTEAGNDKITLGATTTTAYAVDAGAGSDTVSIGATLTAGSTINLGTNDGAADTLVIGAENNVSAASSVTNYNYADGDVIKTGYTNDKTITLDATGKMSFEDANKLTVAAKQADNAYKLKFDNKGTVSEYWTAANGASSVNFDASSMTNVVNVDARGASAAVIASGYGADQISLSAGVNTLKVSKASGNDTFGGAGTLGSDDTLILTDGTLDDLVFNSTTINYAGEGGATLTSAIATGDEGKIKVSTDDGKTSQMVAYTTTTGNSLTASTDVDVYIGAGAETSITSASDVNLYDTAKYKNISKEISVTGSGVFIGAKDATTAINAATATDAVQIWGGSTDANDITLNANGKKSDTVWFGTTDGADKVTDFVGDYGTDDDVLYLYDTADLSKVTFATGKITTGKSTVSIAGSDKINIKLSDGTVKKVAADLTGDGNIFAEYADVVIGDAKTAKTVVYGATQTDAVLVNLYDTGKYQNIVNIDTAAAKAGAVAIGAAGKASKITLGAGTNAVWGGSTDANEISLATGAGTDTVWFGAIDGKDTVAGFQIANDTIKLWDAASTKEIFKNYSVTQAAAKFTVTSSTAKDTTLDVTANTETAVSNTVKFQDASDKVVKAVVSDTANNLTFATDASLYYSAADTTTVTAGNSVTGTITAFLDNGGWADAGDYYFGSKINAFDASKSAAKTVLIGRADQESKLYGGLTENAIWGGGYASQDMQGSVAAVDTIWFGTTDGADKFSKGVDKGDTIYLWDVTSIDNVKINTATAGQETVVLGSSTLNITDAGQKALDGGLTFKISTGASYTYDKATKNFTAKA